MVAAGVGASLTLTVTSLAVAAALSTHTQMARWRIRTMKPRTVFWSALVSIKLGPNGQECRVYVFQISPRIVYFTANCRGCFDSRRTRHCVPEDRWYTPQQAPQWDARAGAPGEDRGRRLSTSPVHGREYREYINLCVKSENHFASFRVNYRQKLNVADSKVGFVIRRYGVCTHRANPNRGERVDAQVEQVVGGDEIFDPCLLLNIEQQEMTARRKESWMRNLVGSKSSASSSASPSLCNHWFDANCMMYPMYADEPQKQITQQVWT